MFKKVATFSALVLGVALVFNLTPARAVTVSYIKDIPVRGDFVVEPGKSNFTLNPGEQAAQVLYVTNRLGEEMAFNLEIEDFKGSKDPNESIVLMGEATGPYSLKSYLHPEINEFTIKPGEKIGIRINIDIPDTAEPGGHFGAVIVTTNPEALKGEAVKDQAKAQVRVVARVGSLFLVRVNGPVKEDGSLNSFFADKNFYQSGPVNFNIITDNNGSVHLATAGNISVYNILGSEVGRVLVDPYFVLPDSVKSRQISFNRAALFGRYRAELNLNLGYQNKTAKAQVVFWVVPWKIVLPGVLVLALVCWLIAWAASHLEIKRKSQ